LYRGILVANYGYDAKTGLEIIQTGNADMVSFGTLAISNPDLVKRI
jgi:N-ethylmaleimide reductase